MCLTLRSSPRPVLLEYFCHYPSRAKCHKYRDVWPFPSLGYRASRTDVPSCLLPLEGNGFHQKGVYQQSANSHGLEMAEQELSPSPPGSEALTLSRADVWVAQLSRQGQAGCRCDALDRGDPCAQGCSCLPLLFSFPLTLSQTLQSLH